MKLGSIDLAVLCGYLGVVVALGCLLSRRSRTAGQFMAAGGRLGGMVVGLSILGTFVSSISFLANPGKSYAENWNPFVFGLSLPIAAAVAVRYFVPMYRRGGSVSAYTHLELRFGRWARLYAGACYLMTQIARVGTILFLVGVAVEPLTGFDVRWIILVTGIAVTAYTLLGGIEAVIWTDVLQSVVLICGMAVCTVVLLQRLDDPAAALQQAAEAGKFSLGSFGGSLTQPTFWVVLVYGLAINLQNFGIDQSYVQRYHAAESDRAAARSVWFGALGYLPVSAVLFLLGTLLFAFYTARPELLPAGGLRADAVFPHFIATQLPAGFAGLLVAAILAAAMSSVDTSLNASATVVLCDFLRGEQAGDRQAMRVLRLSTIVFGVIGTAAALAMLRVETALEAWWKLAGIFSGGMLGLFLLAQAARFARPASALIGVLAGVGLIFWMSVSQTDAWPDALAFLRSPFHSYLTTVFGTLLIFLLGLGLSRLGHRWVQRVA